MCPSFSESRLLGEGAPPAICMDIKTKELLNLHFVSVRKQREGLAIDNRWDLLPLCFCKCSVLILNRFEALVGEKVIGVSGLILGGLEGPGGGRPWVARAK